MDIEKLIFGLAGTVVGWLLKEIRDYAVRRTASYNALCRLHNELSTIRTSAIKAGHILDEANRLAAADRVAAEQVAHGAFALIKALPPIKVYDDKFDSVSQALSSEEKEMARNVISYYNMMRQAFPDRRPDLEGGVFLFEELLNAKCRSTAPLSWFRPKERLQASQHAMSIAQRFLSQRQQTSAQTHRAQDA